MKKREVAEVLLSGLKIFAVFRIIDEDCWLVEQRKARVGEEYIFAARPREEGLVAAGPLVPGTLTMLPDHYRVPPGDLSVWEFMEYRMYYVGQVLPVPYQGRIVKRKPKRS